MKTSDSYKILFVLPVITLLLTACTSNNEKNITAENNEHLWRGWNKYQIPEEDTLTRYGRELIENTSYYLGPKGIVSQITNGMNCQNCHLDGGTVPWGNNYSAVASTYPRFRERSGTEEDIPKRINDCLQRSLNGQAIENDTKEMKAIIAYMTWLGDGIPKDHKPKGSGIMALPYLDRAADPIKGRIVYINNCQRCHGADGQGQKEEGAYSYVYPPLWGQNSYTTAAGLFRVSRFAGYVKLNMPNDVVEYYKPQLSDEEAWDVAAFVNSQPRPEKTFKEDWPDISKKPIDHPFGPYADSFSETQHKLGPFKPIVKVKEDIANKNAGK